jgi:hypothetical protein
MARQASLARAAEEKLGSRKTGCGTSSFRTKLTTHSEEIFILFGMFSQTDFIDVYSVCQKFFPIEGIKKITKK